MSVKIERKTCRAADGVEIVYSVAGKGEPALVFIHGGLANRGFWDGSAKRSSPSGFPAAVPLPEAILPFRDVAGVVGVDAGRLPSRRLILRPGRARGAKRSIRSDASKASCVGRGFSRGAPIRKVMCGRHERRMSGTLPAAAKATFFGMAGYDGAAAAARLTVPLRAINGDLYPTSVEANRKIKPDFEAVIMKHMGHYPMLERPDEFNRLVAETIAGLTR